MKSLQEVLDDAGVKETSWPGDHRLEPGSEIRDEKRGEETKIPVIRNDGKRYNGSAES